MQLGRLEFEILIKFTTVNFLSTACIIHTWTGC